MIEFVSLDSFDLKERGKIFVTTLDRDTDDFSHLIGQVVKLDGKEVTVIAVERYAHSPPWHAGENIALLVRKK